MLRTGLSAALIVAVAATLASACQHVPDGAHTESLKSDQLSAVDNAVAVIRVNTRGEPSWNGKPVSQNELVALMDEAASASPKHQVIVMLGNGARYEDLSRIVAMARDRGIHQKIGVIGGQPN